MVVPGGDFPIPSRALTVAAILGPAHQWGTFVARVGRRRAKSVVGLALAVATSATLATVVIEPVNAVTTAAAASKPNVVIILTDDQRAGTLQPMPNVRKLLRAQGADFDGVIPTSLCCPSRTALLSGNNSHTTGVWTNTPDQGGWPTFNSGGFESKTIATAVDAAGYRTGYFGKYLNYWNRAAPGFVPPGWDTFMATWEEPPGQGAGAYYDYELRGTEPAEVYGSDPADYSTRVVGRHALQFIQDSEASGDPYLTFISVFGPHPPMTPDARDIDAWAPTQPYDNTAVNEANMTDKPPHLQDLPMRNLSQIWRQELKTGQALMSVDRVVGRVMNNVDLSNTLIVFMSDNGFMWGEHRLDNKGWPYRWSTDVPLIMRWDGHLAPGDYGLATNTDVTATILEATGTSGAFPTEGMSVLSGQRNRTVLESAKSPGHPAYCGVRTEQYMFVQYRSGARELYDYAVDPLELDNVAGNKDYAAVQTDLKRSAKNLCDPMPPRFHW